jgi:hypothetical protein
MKKPPRPKPSRSNKYRKEATCNNEDEYETSDFNKEESMEDIDLAIAKSVKHPPRPLSDFKDKCLLPHEGINPHRLRTIKDVLESEMTLMFGYQGAWGCVKLNQIVVVDVTTTYD